MIRDSTFTLFTRGVVIAFALLTSVIVSRLLGPSLKGSYSIILLVLTVAVLICLFGFASSNVYFGARNPEELPTLAGNSILAGLAFGTLGAVAIVALTLLPAFQQYLTSNGVTVSLIRLLALTVPVTLAANYLQEIVRADGRIIEYNLLVALGPGVGLLCVTITVWLLNMGLIGAVISWAIVQFAFLFAAFFLAARVTHFRFDFDLRLLRRNLAFGLRLYPGNLAQFLNYRLDIFLVGVFLSPAEVGLYATATALAERVWELPHAIRTVLLHRVAGAASQTDANQMTVRVIRLISLMLLGICLLLVPLGKPLISLLYGSAYLDATPALLALIPGIWALGIGKLLAIHLAGSGKPETGTYAALVSLMATLALDFLLIPRIGIVGASIASSISYVVSTLLLGTFFMRMTRVGIRDLLLPKYDDLRIVRRGAHGTVQPYRNRSSAQSKR